MQISDCTAFTQAEVSVTNIELATGSDLPRLIIKKGDDEIGVTMNREQLELLLDSAEMWLFKQDELPRAEEIIKLVDPAGDDLRESA